MVRGLASQVLRLTAVLLFLFTGGAGAEDLPPPVVTLPPVTVIGTVENPAGGPAVLPGTMLRQIPPGDGSLSEALRLLPDVQLSEKYRSSRTGGEILPPAVSISGGKAFQNTFIFDGAPIDSLLDPVADNPLILNDVPGHAQELFPGINLVERVSVYDSNIPAQFGGFTGGVVAAEVRDPEPAFGGTMHYRTTRDDWTRFHLSDGEREDFKNSRSVRFQPRFEKHQGGVSLDLPLGTDVSLLSSYQLTYSRIPLRHFASTREQTRQLDEILAKLVGIAGDDILLEGLVLYTPYRAKLFIPNGLGSDFTLRGGGGLLQGTAHQVLPGGEWRLRVGASRSENTREAPPHWRLWGITASRDWGLAAGTPYSAEGGYGTIEKEQDSIFTEISLIAEPFAAGTWGHRLAGGLQGIWTEGSFERKDTSFIYNGVRFNPSVICGDASFDCVDGEQFFNQRVVYPAAATRAQLARYAVYLDDEMTMGRVRLRPGMRLSYDDFTGNLDLAPRLAAHYDIFGQGRTILTAGANRYYGNPLLTYKLRESQKPYVLQYRPSQQNVPGDWIDDPSPGVNVARFSELDTPYVDEFAAGLDQALFGGRLSLKYVQREGRDEFAREYGPVQPGGLRYYTLNNRGRSRHRSYRITWERQWARDFLSLNATYQSSTTSNEDYDDVLEADDTDDRILFEGRVIRRTELPRRDYNRPVILNLIWTRRFPFGIHFANVAQYRGGYRAIQNTYEKEEIPAQNRRVNPLTGEEIVEYLAIYRKRKFEDAIILDWRVSWETEIFTGRAIRFNLDINNVLDTRVPTGPDPASYQLGRQFWAGAEYRF